MKTVSRFILMLILLLPGAGCAVDHDREMLPYRQELGIDRPVPQIEASSPLTLRGLLELTGHHYEPLQIEGERYIQAVIDRRRAVAEFLPTLTMAPSFAHESGSAVGSFRSSPDEFEMPTNFQINLFRGFSDVARLYAGARTIEQRRALLLGLQEETLLDAVRAFYETLRLERSVEVLAGTAEVQEARVKDIQARLNAGLARPLESLQAEAQSAETRLRLLEAQNALRNARSALELLAHVPMQTRPLVDEFEPPAEAGDLDVLRRQADQGRFEIAAAEAALEAARHGVDVAFGQYYPSVTLNIEYLLTVNNVVTEQGWTTVLRANVPILSAGRIEADVRQAWSGVRRAYLEAVLTRRQVRHQVETAFHDYQSSGERIRQLQHRLVAAELALQQSEASYDVGLATSLDRLAAQDVLLGARLEWITQHYGQKIAYLRLLRSTGALRRTMAVGDQG